VVTSSTGQEPLEALFFSKIYAGTLGLERMPWDSKVVVNILPVPAVTPELHHGGASIKYMSPDYFALLCIVALTDIYPELFRACMYNF
jgi:hypothetical protein